MKTNLGFATVLGLALAACSGSFEPAGGGADAGPDQAARDDFATNVAPILAAKCDSCHKTGQVNAPVFESDYESIATYVNPTTSVKLLGCTSAASLLYSKGAHSGPAFDTTTEAPKVTAFIDLWAAAQTECQGTGAAKPSTGKLLFQDGANNSVDLSTLGPGLEGATMTFAASATGGGLLLSEVTITAGANGLHVVKPRFETCKTGTAELATDIYSTIDVTIEPGATQTLGGASINGAAIADAYGIRFETLTPKAGAQGEPVDNGGSCAP